MYKEGASYSNLTNKIFKNRSSSSNEDTGKFRSYLNFFEMLYLYCNDSILKDREIVFDMIKNGNEKDFGDNDIVKDEGHTIFEIISRRYQVSGVKRLFE